MTRKEQNKILDGKIEANKRQYDLDRTNAEISAYSSGDLPKYEYLTKKDLGYKPNAFEQGKFEYSPLNKVFTDGLNKSDRKEGLLKRLKNIENKSNTQLLAIRDINRPAIRGRNDDDDDDGDDDDKAYRTIVEDYRNNKISYKSIKDKLNEFNKNIELYKKNKKLFKNIPGSRHQITKNKKFAKVLKRFTNEILSNKIRKKYKSIGSKKVIDITWIDDSKLFNQINNDVTTRYRKDRKSPELLSIQNFSEDINNEYIKNKKDVSKDFKDLKNNVKSENLKDIVKELERAIFGYDDEKESSGSGLKILTKQQISNI